MKPTIKFQLGTILEEKGVSIRQAARDLGEGNPEKTRRLASNEGKSINFDMLAKLCSYLRRPPGSFFKLEGIEIDEEIIIPDDIAYFLNIGLIQQCKFLKSNFNNRENSSLVILEREYQKLKRAVQHTDDQEVHKLFSELQNLYQGDPK